MTLVERDNKVIREGETHVIAVCITGFDITPVICFCAIWEVGKHFIELINTDFIKVHTG